MALMSMELILIAVLLLTGYSEGSVRCLEHYDCQIQDVEKVVTCKDPAIDVVPICLNPKLIRLSLHKTQIRTIYVTSFRFYGHLAYVNLSENKISSIEDKTFGYQKQLEELHLASNFIGNLNPDTFSGLHELKVLSLKNNILDSIPDGVFKKLTNLQQLDISHNRITSIGQSAFQGLRRLLVLHLSGNQLTSVPSFTSMPHLAELSIGGNLFNLGSSLQPLINLSYLDLSDTNFSLGLNQSALPKHLRVLDLTDCQLNDVPNLSELTTLESLILDKNSFKSVERGAFNKNRDLQSLSISGCPSLERIGDGSLENKNIKHLDLSRNPKLAFLPSVDFHYLSSLSTLDLHGNNLAYIPENLVVWGDVDWKLNDNPIVCNCSVAWLRKLVIENNSSIVCHLPLKLQGQPLSSVALVDLSCGMSATTRDIAIALPICLLLLMGFVAFCVFHQNRTCVRRLLKRHKLKRHSHRSCDSEYPCIKPIPVTEL